MPETILVTGAAGQLGRLVIAELLARGVPAAGIVAATRDPAKIADLTARGVVTRRADFDDPATLAGAFAGVGRALIISTDAIGEPGKRLRQHQAAVAAAAAAGVGHLLYTSMPNPETSRVTFAPDHLGTEQAIRASGLRHTILRSGWYMENLFMALPQALASGRWYTAAGQGRVAHIARADIAAAVAGALAAGGGSNATFTLTGAEALTVDEIAALVTEATGRPLEVVHLSDEQLAQGMEAAGVPAFLIPTLVSFDANTREGHIAMVTGDAQRLSGRKPMSLAAFLGHSRQALAA